jgi:hypothetical protein
LPRTPGARPSPYPNRRERRLDELEIRRGSSVKVVSQRKTPAVDRHHPLRPLAPLGLADGGAPFSAGAKLPSRNDSLHLNSCRSFNPPRKARQISSQTSCASQSRSLRQQVAGAGNSSGKSCHRAPLRSSHKMPSSTLRSSAPGRPPCGRLGLSRARAGSVATGRRSAADRIVPSALPLALLTSALHLHRKTTTLNSAPCTGF